MYKKIILACFILCAAVVRAENRRGLLEALFGTTAIQMSNLNKYEDGEDNKSSEKTQAEKHLSGIPGHYPDTIHFPIPTFQTVVIHRPHPEPIHIHKPPKDEIIIHEEKPHQNHYYVVKPHIQHEEHQYVGYGNDHNKKPHESHGKPVKAESKPIVIIHKPEYDHHVKPQLDHIFIDKPPHYDKPTHGLMYKPVYEVHNEKPLSSQIANKKPEPNIIIQIVSDKPTNNYGTKPQIIQINPNLPISGSLGPIQISKPTDTNNHQDSSPVFITGSKPDLDSQFSTPQNVYPIIIQEMVNAIKDPKPENDDKENTYESSQNTEHEITKKPISLWDLITKPFQVSTPTQTQNDDEACNEDSGAKPLRCIFKSNNKRLNSTDSSKMESEDKQNENINDEGSGIVTQFVTSAQLPSIFPQFWLPKPMLQNIKQPAQPVQRRPQDVQQNVETDAVINEEDDESENSERHEDADDKENTNEESIRSFTIRQGRKNRLHQ